MKTRCIIGMLAVCVILMGCASTHVYVSGDDRTGHHITADRRPLIGWREFYEFDLRPNARDNGAMLAQDVAPVSYRRGLNGIVQQYTAGDLYGFVDYESSGHISIQLLRKETAGNRVRQLQLPINGRFKAKERANPNQAPEATSEPAQGAASSAPQG